MIERCMRCEQPFNHAKVENEHGFICLDCWRGRTKPKPECAHIFTGHFPPYAQFHCTGEVNSSYGGKPYCLDHWRLAVETDYHLKCDRERRIKDAKERVIAAAKALLGKPHSASYDSRIALDQAVDALIAVEKEGA